MPIVKTIAALLLLASLALPISEQAWPAFISAGAPQAGYIITKAGGYAEWIWAASFGLPLLITLAVPRARSTIQLIINLLSTLPATWAVYLHSDFSDLAIGGYLAMTSIIIFIFTVITEAMLANRKTSP